MQMKRVKATCKKIVTTNLEIRDTITLLLDY